MPQETRKATEAKARQRLAETLRKARADIAANVDVGEGAPRAPRIVNDMVCDLLDLIDAQIEELTSDRDEDVDNAIDDLGR